jgi:hypothetical protein
MGFADRFNRRFLGPRGHGNCAGGILCDGGGQYGNFRHEIENLGIRLIKQTRLDATGRFDQCHKAEQTSGADLGLHLGLIARCVYWLNFLPQVWIRPPDPRGGRRQFPGSDPPQAGNASSGVGSSRSHGTLPDANGGSMRASSRTRKARPRLRPSMTGPPLAGGPQNLTWPVLVRATFGEREDSAFSSDAAPRRSPWGEAGWCGWSGSNRHSLRNRILSPARLPIPPHPRGRLLYGAVEPSSRGFLAIRAWARAPWS